MALVQVKDTKYIRDTSTMALINANVDEKNEYYSKVRMVNAQKAEINTLKNDIDTLKDDMSSIKSMLEQLINKGQ